jgi:Leucine-rich repeat (LRR) protein
MIQNYKDYIKEELDFKKFFKKDLYHLNNKTKKDDLNNVHLDIDPFNEEDWDIDNLSPLLQIVRKTYGNKPYDEILGLDCSENHLTTLEGVENLVSLERLYCYNNHLTSLEGVENLVNLEEIYCGGNQLTSLESVKNLVNLEELSCYNNQLTSLEGIENLVNLERLYCYYNQLTSLEGVENLVNLDILSCDNNRFNREYKIYLEEYCRNKNIQSWIW